MAIREDPKPSALEPNEDAVVYVDYLESAPWNSRAFPDGPRVFGIGTVMIAEAIRISQELGHRGRVGLHSLPQSEPFYSERCRMTHLGVDENYYELVYFEYTEEQATAWLDSVGLS